MASDANSFDGEFWNVNLNAIGMTRFQFSERAGRRYVSAWGRCFPTDCEWGETKLYILKTVRKSHVVHAFATWRFGSELVHFAFKMKKEELFVESFSLLSEFQYFAKEIFKKDAVRTLAAPIVDPINSFAHMWDGSEPGWKLVQYKQPVYLVEFHFKKAGPTRRELSVSTEFIKARRESDEQLWKRMRGCTGIMVSQPLGKTRITLLKKQQKEMKLNLSIYRIAPDDFLVIAPKGYHYCWVAFDKYRKPVVKRMLAAGVPIESRELK